ncbi:MAG TPA: HEAT repeat domain-containing protein [Planctomycetota bacterium]
MSIRHLGLVLASCAAAMAWAGEADPYAEILSYKLGQKRAPMLAIDAAARAATPEQTKDIEAKLIKALQDANASHDCKVWVIWKLRELGSEASVAPLAALLADKDLGVRACIALQSIAGSKADDVLRDALPKLSGEIKGTVAQTLGFRGDKKAVALLAGLMADADTKVAHSAIYGLGRIGGGEAIAALKSAKVSDENKAVRWQALLHCADRAMADGTADAGALYGLMWKDGETTAVKIAGLRGLALTDKTQAVVALSSAIKDKNRKIQTAAVQILAESKDPELFGKVLGDFAALEPEQQLVILALAEGKAVLPAALKSLQSENAEVRLAAIGALGRAGGAAEVPALLLASEKSDADAKEVQSALGKLKDAVADEALLEAAKKPEPKAAKLALVALTGRRCAKALPAMMELATSADAGVRSAALEGVRTMAGAQDVPAMFALLGRLQSENERGVLETGILALCRATRAGAPGAPTEGAAGASPAEPLIAALGAAGAVPQRLSILRMLGRIGGAKALDAVRGELKNADEAVRDAAVRSIADWAGPEAAPELLAIAGKDENLTHHVLALRGLLRLATTPGFFHPDKAKELLAQAAGVAKRDEEKAMLKTALERPLKATNLARSATATNLDGLQPDGQSGPPSAAIDGDPKTYWDETDGQNLYRLQLAWPNKVTVCALRIMGFAHHNYAPKDFDVVCDGKVVKEVRGAVYENNLLVVPLPTTLCEKLELKITGYYGQSPGIRELEVYDTPNVPAPSEPRP